MDQKCLQRESYLRHHTALGLLLSPSHLPQPSPSCSSPPPPSHPHNLTSTCEISSRTIFTIDYMNLVRINWIFFKVKTWLVCLRQATTVWLCVCGHVCLWVSAYICTYLPTCSMQKMSSPFPHLMKLTIEAINSQNWTFHAIQHIT